MAKAPPDTRPLVNFFLTLFQLQVVGRADQTGGSRASLVSEKPGEDSIYEFYLRHRGQLKTRRMSLRSLGEQVGSKSSCFKVIYDDLLVVKIPPRPITDFNNYLQHIRQEHEIANRLMPKISCVYPNLGSILKRVPDLRLPADISPEESERLYIEKLIREPELQKYLKIGSSFVFFMNLSQHRFFNQVITSMHQVRPLARREIIKNGPEALSDYYAFETLYGADNDKLFFDLHALAKSYEDSVEQIISKAGYSNRIPDYEKKEIFYYRLAGIKKDIESLDDSSSGIAGKIDAQVTQLMQENEEVVKNFQTTVQSVVKQKNFEFHRSQAKALTINILDLLYKLRKRSVTIRDLKPDNLYVAANLDGAEHLLSDPNAFELGLIDLETALHYKADENGRFAQPLLAATPTYATPSHIFNNRILEAAHSNGIKRIFRMQDWFAAMVMIFYVVTGRLLFLKTARLVPELSRLKKQFVRQPQEQFELYRNGSRRFWKTARQEFEYRKHKYEAQLQDVEILLPRHLEKLLYAECEYESLYIKKEIGARIDDFSCTGTVRRKLLAASHAQILGMLKKKNKSRAADDSGAALIELISRIEPMKRQQSDLSAYKKHFGSPIPCDVLISFLFDRVSAAMAIKTAGASKSNENMRKGFKNQDLN